MVIDMDINRYEFEVLKYLKNDGFAKYDVREISNILSISCSRLSEAISNAIDKKYIHSNNSCLFLTDKGQRALEPFEIKKAIILAAGFGTRMVPVTLETPKPLVEVNGKRIIDTLLDALIGHGINEIIIVRGYKKDKFDILLEKYNNIRFIDNDDYDKTNNISSLISAVDELDQCYICEADFFISNPNIINRYHYASNYLGASVLETDDWCFDIDNGCVKNYRKSGKYCYNAYGISAWTKEDCKKLRSCLLDAYSRNDGKDIFWEFVPLVLYKDMFDVEVKQCLKKDIVEIDNFYELVQLDPTYEKYKKE